MMRFILITLSVLWLFCYGTEARIYRAESDKIKGLVFTGPGKGPLKDDSFISMAHCNGNYVALVPEAIVYRQSLKINYDFERQWYGETSEAVLAGVSQARKNGLKVMIKPHLTVGWDMSNWDEPSFDINDSLSLYNNAKSADTFIKSQENKFIGKTSWRGDLMTKSVTDWRIFEREYTKFILDYAKIADSLNVELFCIGTELKRIALEKPAFMQQLISKVRNIYKGNITYAANWDSYEKIDFWDELDYIGIDAYFPLSDEKFPEIEGLKESWCKVSSRMKATSKRFEKKIIFTEWGYENEEYVGREPWKSGGITSFMDSNESMQSKAYISMFETVWHEPWLKGIFVWRWEPESAKSELMRPNYSPRFKEAEIVLRDWFGEN